MISLSDVVLINASILISTSAHARTRRLSPTHQKQEARRQQHHQHELAINPSSPSIYILIMTSASSRSVRGPLPLRSFKGRDPHLSRASSRTHPCSHPLSCRLNKFALYISDRISCKVGRSQRIHGLGPPLREERDGRQERSISEGQRPPPSCSRILVHG